MIISEDIYIEPTDEGSTKTIKTVETTETGTVETTETIETIDNNVKRTIVKLKLLPVKKEVNTDIETKGASTIETTTTTVKEKTIETITIETIEKTITDTIETLFLETTVAITETVGKKAKTTIKRKSAEHVNSESYTSLRAE